MNETMALFRAVFETENRWTFLIDGTSRAAIEAAFVSVLEPGDRIVIANCGRFGDLLTEIAERCAADITLVTANWGKIVEASAIEEAVARVRPRLFACVHGDTSTTMAQPLEGVGDICRKYGALFLCGRHGHSGRHGGKNTSMGHRHRDGRIAEMPRRSFRQRADDGV